MKTATRFVSDFKCLHCRLTVSAASWLAGVQHRNHCPYCLYSRHLDLFEAGDRLAACRSGMQPVGLTMKKRRNKYAEASQGELMVVHLCLECGKVALNRIAADDDYQRLLSLLKPTAQLRRQLDLAGVQPLGSEDASLVRRCLRGNN